MFAPFALALTLAAAAAAQATPPVATAVEVVSRLTLGNGQRKTTSLFRTSGDLRTPQTMFVFVPDSVCDSIAVSKTEPRKALYAWRIFAGPVTYAPGSTAPVRADVMLTTQRMWNGGKKGPDAPMFLALPTQAAAPSGVIDTVPAPSAPGSCGASTLTLEAHLVYEVPAERPARKLLEAELWFVHKAPDGKETAQRQVVRMRDGGNGEFYFDDLELQTVWLEQKINLTVEVFGSLIALGEMKGDQVDVIVALSRRYLTKQFLIGSWPKKGDTQLQTSVRIGEVVSFVLPPLTDDSGVFLGHRFSVRMRLKPVGEEQ
jgi:hypothetical protein